MQAKQLGPGREPGPGPVAVELLLFREQCRHVPAGFQSEMRAGCIEYHLRPPQSTFHAVTRDMRGGEIDPLQQISRNLRFTFPGVEEYGYIVTFVQQLEQGGVVDHLATRRVDQQAIRVQALQSVFIEHVVGRVPAVTRQRHVQADEVAFPQNRVESDEVPVAVAGFQQRWIAQQAVDAERVQFLPEARPDVAVADDARPEPERIESLVLRQREQTADDVLGSRLGVAAGRVAAADAGVFEIFQVDVIGADGRGADKLYRRAVE